MSLGPDVAGEPLVLRLFVAGGSRRSAEAERVARAIVADHGGPNGRLEVIDVFEEPGEAEQAGVLATPTLVRASPGPEARVIGTLEDRELIVELLDLPARRTGKGP